MNAQTFTRTPGERQFRLMINGRKEFFLFVYCADGSFCEYGPFDSGEAALEQQNALEHPTFEDWEIED